ncbi:hypothetical protein [Streptomyces zhihengii]
MSDLTGETHRLSLLVVVPGAPRKGASVELRPFVDGEDILARAFTDGPGEDPRHLLLPDGPFTADAEPHEVRLAEAECTEGCCGALYVTVRHEGDHVIWGGWRNPDEDEVELPEFRFDAREYRAEVDRAVHDLSWEWPARTVARLLERHLRERADALARWECELNSVSAWSWEPDRIRVLFWHPGRSALMDGRPWLQFQLTLDVSGDASAAQAERLAEYVLRHDPRRTGEVCGGSSEYADRLGYPWPPRSF